MGAESSPSVEAIARTLLYEGYLLYPYRQSAVKNRQRFNFGVLHPPAFCQPGGPDRSALKMQIPVLGDGSTRVLLSVRFLQLFDRTPAEHDRLETGVDSWLEAAEREIALDEVSVAELQPAARVQGFMWPRVHASPPAVANVIRGVVELRAEEVRTGVYRITADLANVTPFDAAGRDAALLHSMVSAHLVLRMSGGELVSLLEPPEDLRDVAAECVNEGVWPVLVGDDGRRDCVLASPIILYDYPRIAPESPGDLFDGTEIDEILALRILTLTDEEKREAREGDERVRRILDRTDTLPVEAWEKLHGAMRGWKNKAVGEAP
jgi:hydrogenase maturation protease